MTDTTDRAIYTKRGTRYVPTTLSDQGAWMPLPPTAAEGVEHG